MDQRKIGGYVKYPLFLISIICIIIGMVREEHLTVLKKAVNICLECIGVG